MATDSEIRAQRFTSTKWRNYPDDILPAWIADMDLGIADEIVEAIQKPIDSRDLGYGSIELQEKLLDAFTDRYLEKFNTPLDPALAVVGTDVVQSIFAAILGFTQIGDQVIIQTPIYPPFLDAVISTGRTLSENPLIRTEQGWEIDFGQLEQLAAQPECKLLLLCSPHNPTGKVFTQTELIRIANICVKHDILVVSDEIHCDIVYSPNYHIPFASISPEFASRVITMNSATKSFNIAGLKCSITHFGSEELMSLYNQSHPRIRGSVSNLAMIAATAAWQNAAKWLESTLATLETNRDKTYQFLDQSGLDVSLFPPQGTYLAWIDFRNSIASSDPYQYLLEKAKVALSPGSDFGTPGIGWARLNFATHPEILDDILKRIAAVL
jgi:cystathionine beta-lyase